MWLEVKFCVSYTAIYFCFNLGETYIATCTFETPVKASWTTIKIKFALSWNYRGTVTLIALKNLCIYGLRMQYYSGSYRYTDYILYIPWSKYDYTHEKTGWWWAQGSVVYSNPFTSDEAVWFIASINPCKNSICILGKKFLSQYISVNMHHWRQKQFSDKNRDKFTDTSSMPT